MIIKNIFIKSYKKKLSNTFTNAKNKYLYIDGFIITVIGNTALHGKGEVSPLKNFSKESNQEILGFFNQFVNLLSFDKDIAILDLLKLINDKCKTCPSLVFGIETAIFDLFAKENKIGFLKAINPKFTSGEVKFSGIYYNCKSHLKFAKNKLKIGIDSIDNDVSNIQSIIKAMPEKSLLRLDANQSYNVSDYIELSSKIDVSKIEYVEEPIKNPTTHTLSSFRENTSFNIAIDESLYNNNYKEWIDHNLIKAIVVKPSIYGSYLNFLELNKYAMHNNLQLILSSALEMEIGNMAIIHLASYLNSKEHHGINIYSFYDNINMKNIYNKKDESINVDSLVGLGLW